MSLQNPLIANEAIYSAKWKDYFYPQTVDKQVIMSNGERLNAYLSGMVIPSGMELLWENPNPSAEFAAQKISISNLGEYNVVKIVYRDEITTNIFCTIDITERDISYDARCGYDRIRSRYYTINSDNTITVNDGRFQTGIGTFNTANTVCVPYKIYGIKENVSLGGEGTLLNADMLGGVAAEEYVKKSESGMKLLWTNASPSSAFAAQTINLDLSKYSRVLVVGGFDVNYYTTKFTAICAVGNNSNIVKPTGYRSFSVSTTGVTFGDGDSVNKELIPLNIYGIK